MQRREATERVGEALTAALAETRTTQAQIGRTIGASQTAVSTWCRGEALPSIAQIVAIDVALGWPRGTLLRRADLVELRPLAEVIENDPALDDMARAQLMTVYHELTFQVARRRNRALGGGSHGSNDDTEEIPIPPAPALGDDVEGASGQERLTRDLVARLAPAIATAVVDAIGPFTKGGPT